MMFQTSYKSLGILLVLSQLAFLPACSNNSDTLFLSQSKHAIKYGEYEVQKGDSLYSIAWRYKRDYKELARINGIKPPYIIQVGQKIKLAANQDEIPSKNGYTGLTIVDKQASQPHQVNSHHTRTKSSWFRHRKNNNSNNAASSHIDWQWPAKGKVIQGFSTSSNSVGQKGIQIAGTAGDPVFAAADGVVVYSGNSLVGYGNLVIVKHNDTYLTAYAHNRRVLVKEGDKVVKGQKIAEMGSSGTDRTKLHFEIRKEGQPVNPLSYLPR